MDLIVDGAKTRQYSLCSTIDDPHPWRLGILRDPSRSGASLYVHDTALQSFDMLRLDGRVRPEIRPTLAIHGSKLALYHHEPHMRRVEYQIWVDYGTARPAALGIYDGVPVVWLYRRP